ncbi:FMN-binding protein [Paraglaciecola sp.]|uniref:FMN-binding protein n=1 Tax=Paraglaciecola sp. TaxID=1920173 RepID=UPI0030F4090A
MKNWATVVFIPTAAIITPVYAVDFMSETAAQKLLFTSADEFVSQSYPLNDDMKDRIKDIAHVTPRYDEQRVSQVNEKGIHTGWFFVDNVIGKHEFITYALAIDTAGKVLGVEILSYRETHGGQVRNPQWRINFVGKTVEDRFKLNNDIPNISGATLSCRNVTDGVKRLLAIHQLVLADHT